MVQVKAVSLHEEPELARPVDRSRFEMVTI
jgi:hypothetical protein